MPFTKTQFSLPEALRHFDDKEPRTRTAFDFPRFVAMGLAALVALCLRKTSGCLPLTQGNNSESLGSA